MSVIRDNLLPGEEIVLYGKPHWFGIIPHLTVVVLFAMTIIPAVLVNAVGWFFCFSGPCLIFAGAATLDAFAKYITTEMVITNQRFITVGGLFNRRHFDIILSRIEGIWIVRSMIGNILNYGTLILSVPGGGKHTFALVHSPQEFREVLQQQVAASKTKRTSEP